jgi:hypothetical protein
MRGLALALWMAVVAYKTELRIDDVYATRAAAR